jgi:hypothetical protein
VKKNKKFEELESTDIREAFLFEVFNVKDENGVNVYKKCVESLAKDLADDKLNWHKRQRIKLILQFIDKLTPRTIGMLAGESEPTPIKIIMQKNDDKL